MAQAARTHSARRTARTHSARRTARTHSARRTAHRARRTAHGARRTAHGARRTAHGARQPEGGCAWRGGQGERGVEAGHWRAYRLRQAATGAAGSMEPLRSTPRLAFPREQLAVGVCSVVAGSTPCASEPGLVTSSRCRARNQAAESECGREARGGVGGWGGGRGRTDVGIVLGGGMYRKMATEATAMGEAMEAMVTGEARRVMMAGTARATATATTKTAVLPAKML